MVSSERWSALEAKLAGPFTDTCSCSTSPKSRVSPLPALRAAAIITVIKAEAGMRESFDDEKLVGGEPRSGRPSPGRTGWQAAGVRRGGWARLPMWQAWAQK